METPFSNFRPVTRAFDCVRMSRPVPLWKVTATKRPSVYLQHCPDRRTLGQRVMGASRIGPRKSPSVYQSVRLAEIPSFPTSGPKTSRRLPTQVVNDKGRRSYGRRSMRRRLHLRADCVYSHKGRIDPTVARLVRNATWKLTSPALALFAARPP